MDLKLKGRIALVTGSTSGIGAAIAQTLLEEGATVLVNGRDESRTAEAAEKLKAYGDAHAAAGDVSTAEGAQQVVEAARRVGEVDILVNNAGVFTPKPFFEITDDDWETMFKVNVMSGVRMSRLLAPGMKDRGWGRVVFIASESALNIPVEMVHYGMTKTAQLSVARGLAKTLSGTGVTVNSVLPGPTWSEGVEQFVREMAESEGISEQQMKEEFVPRNRPGSLIERFAEPAEVASLVAYVCSERASATTGAALRVDGGIVDTIA
ncbi:3-oxoacyl-[acyl-carrier-protein] reductase FabG [Botrimarina colliarenosi]|uniref:3-oxoacyl-[acyl-carrier-protein] reductase FabG n=1 Tax=Botrimarina colliarenosi TaxID=2528001 RepID=A0A5C6AJN9_9BACT|nr:SDR family oxidoreductase [Botrimarina colliarenosi]TWT99626.1 3-oxoacyl-[acyl-carrier-protein] reductase FabG [Botrimarina colliarenosi]